MSDFATHPTTHQKKYGKIHICEWCGQRIENGEIYQKWLYFDGDSRSTVYAHIECAEVWEEDDFPCRSYERPTQKDLTNP